MAVPGAGFVTVLDNVNVAASATKSVMAIIAGANTPLTLVELSVGFDSTSATAGKARVQLCQSTQATAGTSTAFTPLQVRGQAATATATAAINFSAEPTVLTVTKEWTVDLTTGLTVQFPLGREPTTGRSGDTVKAFVVRVIMPATAANCTGYIEHEE